MCEPVSIAMMVVSTALSVVGAKMQADQQKAAYEANATSAVRATVNSYEGIGNRQQQERAKAATEQFDIGLQMASAKSSATAAAGETGTAAGVSFDALLTDYESRGGRSLDNVAANFEMTNDSLQAEKKATQSRGEMAINSMPRPNDTALWADVGAKLATGGAKLYGMTQKKV